MYAPFGPGKKSWPSVEAYQQEMNAFRAPFKRGRYWTTETVAQADKAWFSKPQHMGPKGYAAQQRAQNWSKGRTHRFDTKEIREAYAKIVEARTGHRASVLRQDLLDARIRQRESVLRQRLNQRLLDALAGLQTQAQAIGKMQKRTRGQRPRQPVKRRPRRPI